MSKYQVPEAFLEAVKAQALKDGTPVSVLKSISALTAVSDTVAASMIEGDPELLWMCSFALLLPAARQMVMEAVSYNEKLMKEFGPKHAEGREPWLEFLNERFEQLWHACLEENDPVSVASPVERFIIGQMNQIMSEVRMIKNELLMVRAHLEDKGLILVPNSEIGQQIEAASQMMDEESDMLNQINLMTQHSADMARATLAQPGIAAGEEE